MSAIQIHDKWFEPFIEAQEIEQAVRRMAREISEGYPKEDPPIFVVLLKGAFVFASDLMRYCDLDSEVQFVRLSSYKGLKSSGELKMESFFDSSLKNKHVLVVEDIVDTGNTLSSFIPSLEVLGPKSVRVASLLSKPEILKGKIHIDYLGFEIPPAFVVGYGMDYDEKGRSLPSIYQLKS